MDEKTTYWASLILGALALVLLVVNISVANGNRNMQVEVTQRQAMINSSTAFSQVNKGLVQALADISIKNSDSEARELLAGQGITVKPGAKGEAAAKEESKEKESKKKLDNQELQ